MQRSKECDKKTAYSTAYSKTQHQFLSRAKRNLREESLIKKRLKEHFKKHHDRLHEEKRKIIGNEFVKVFEEEAEKVKGVKFLGQGTLILM